MTDHIKGAVWGCFAADSLALGAHWIYDTTRIRREFGRVDRLLGPLADSYHSFREKGDFTHYGDQTLVLLESVAAKKGFDLLDFSNRWKALFTRYNGYVDQATRGTLTNFATGKGPEEAGSPSDDLAGAARIAPLLLFYHDDLDGLVAAAMAQTRMTHRNPLVVEASAFFSRLTFAVLHGTAPGEALENLLPTANPRLKPFLERGTKTSDLSTVEVINGFGQSCHLPEALPGVVHLIRHYEKDLPEALIQSVMAGGDSAARGMLTGMVLGAWHGLNAIPHDWLAGLKQRERIHAAIGNL